MKFIVDLMSSDEEVDEFGRTRIKSKLTIKIFIA